MGLMIFHGISTFLLFYCCLPLFVWHLTVLVSNESTSTDADDQNGQSNEKSLQTVQSQTDALDTFDHLALVVLVQTGSPDNLTHSSATGTLAVVRRDALSLVVAALLPEAHWLIALVLTRVFIGPAIFTLARFAFAAGFVARLAAQTLSAEFRAVVAPVARFSAFFGFWSFGGGRDGGGQENES